MAISNRREAVTAVVWMILGLIVALWSAAFPFGEWKAPGPAFLPFSLGLILALLGLILFLKARRKSDKDIAAASLRLLPQGDAFKRVILSLIALTLAAAFLEVLGFTLTIFCLILFLMRIIEPPSWRITLLYSVVVAVGSFVLFHLLLKTPLPRGFVGF